MRREGSEMSDFLKGSFESKDLGHSKISTVVYLAGEEDFWKFVKCHLLSEDIEYVYDIDTNEGVIFVGGFRKVGTFRHLMPTFEARQDQQGEE